MDESSQPSFVRPNLTPTNSTVLNHRDYTVGWICALPTEMAAARGMLDVVHQPLRRQQVQWDQNNYSYGQIGQHNVVIACLPSGVTGPITASNVAQQMLSSFKGIGLRLMVGIGGGVPSEKADIRLGDVVVSKPEGEFGGVIQYDHGKTVEMGKFKRTGMLRRPSDDLLAGVSGLQAKQMIEELKLSKHIEDMMKRYPKSVGKFSRPATTSDRLYDACYDHPTEQRSCAECDEGRLVDRRPRLSEDPVVHYGLIATGNQVMKHGLTRDAFASELGVLCFEMEAAGLMDHFHCLVIRGISDYADTHKNDLWQRYAAATAAAYAKELLLGIAGPGLEEAGQSTATQQHHSLSATIPTMTDLLALAQSIITQQHHSLSVTIPNMTDAPALAQLTAIQQHHSLPATIPNMTNAPALAQPTATQQHHSLSATIPNMTDAPALAQLTATQQHHSLPATIPNMTDAPALAQLTATQQHHSLSTTIPTMTDAPVLELTATQQHHSLSATIPNITDTPALAQSTATQQYHSLSATITARFNSTRRKFIKAAERGDNGTLEDLLKHTGQMSRLNKGTINEALIAVSSNEERKDEHVATVQLLLERGAELGCKDDKYHRTPLIWAVISGRVEIVDVFLNNAALIDTRDERRDWTPLMWAVAYGRDAITKRLVDQGASLKATDGKLGRTPLLWAVEKGSHGAVKILLQKNRELTEAQGNDKLTPLALAYMKDDKSAAKLLVECGADTCFKFKSGLPLLISAMMAGDEFFSDLLVTNGADVHSLNKDGLTPLALAYMKGDVATARLLIRYGADTSFRFKSGLPLLVSAVVAGDGDFVHLLASNGADSNCTSNDDVPALTIAVKKGYQAIAEILINKGAKLEAQDKQGRTALIWAVGLAHRDLVKLLVEKGANRDAADQKGPTIGRTVAEWAKLTNNPRIIELV